MGLTTYMEDWKNEVEKAENEYEKYKVIQGKNYILDFNRLLSETKQIENK